MFASDDDLDLKNLEVTIDRINADKYSAHFIQIQIAGMTIWSSFEQIIAFKEFNKDQVFVLGKNSDHKRTAHAEYVRFPLPLYPVGKSTRIFSLSKFVNLFNSAFHRSIVKYAQTIMTKRLLKED